MIHIPEVLLPVLVMIGLGAWTRCAGWISSACVDGMKFLMTKIVLPVAIFNALATAAFSSDIAIYVLIMSAMLILSFGIGFVLRPLVKAEHRKYVPWLVSFYEGGMIGYPLYSALCGAENLSYIAILDIAGMVLGFSVWLNMFHRMDKGESSDAKSLLRDSLRNPAFIACLLGLLVGLTGLGKLIAASPFGNAYRVTADMITSPLNAIILLIVGYEIAPERKRLASCLRVIGLRVVLQALMGIGVLWAIHLFTTPNMLIDLAVVMYVAAPPPFSLQSFTSSEEGSAYVSTVNSLYCFVSIAVYAAAALMR